MPSKNGGSTCPTFSGPRNTAGRRARAHNLDMAARGLDFPEAFPKNEAMDFAVD
jgi:hypothetical protein